MPTDVASNVYTTELYKLNKCIARACSVGETSNEVETLRTSLLDVCRTLREFQKFVIAHVASNGIDAEALEMAGASNGDIELGITKYLAVK